MNIRGMDGLTLDDLHREIAQGGRFVFYKYCVSAIVLTFQRPSDVYFVRGGESAVWKGCGYSAITALFGWWGIPWGPIYSVNALLTNFRGGHDVTNEVLCDLAHRPDAAQSPRASVTVDSTADTVA
jgi:hypothetical protein